MPLIPARFRAAEKGRLNQSGEACVPDSDQASGGEEEEDFLRRGIKKRKAMTGRAMTRGALNASAALKSP
jgi:hypothetical protein